MGIRCLSSGTFLGCNPKSNEVTKITVGKKTEEELILGPAKIYRPLYVVTCKLGDIFVVSGREHASNQPLVSVFQMHSELYDRSSYVFIQSKIALKRKMSTATES